MADSKRIAELKEKVALLPESPGIYQFLGADGRVIYVGKAKNLKRRVYSYFTSKANESAESARDGLADRRPEAHGRGNRERGFPARKQHDQKSSAAVQYPAEGRQDLSVDRDPQRTVSARTVHPAARARRFSAISGRTLRSISRKRCSTWCAASTACARVR